MLNNRDQYKDYRALGLGYALKQQPVSSATVDGGNLAPLGTTNKLLASGTPCSKLPAHGSSLQDWVQRHKLYTSLSQRSLENPKPSTLNPKPKALNCYT